MRPVMRLITILLAISMTALSAPQSSGRKPAARPTAPPLRLVKTVSLPGVEGRIGPMAADPRSQRLFVVAPASDSVEVIDVRTGQRIRSIRDLKRPQGIAYDAKTNRLFVSTRADSKLAIIDAGSYGILQRVSIAGGDPGAVHISPSDERVLVGYNAGLLVFDVNGRQLNEIHSDSVPEDFVVESAGPRVWINLPASRSIGIVRRSDRTVSRTSPITSRTASGTNRALAVDERGHALFVVTRRPANLIILNSDAGFQVESRQTINDPETVSYDAANGRIYITGSEPFIDAVKQIGAGKYDGLPRIPCVGGGRSALLASELSLFFNAVPKSGSEPAAIHIFEVNR